MNARTQAILALSDGRPAKEIAKILGGTPSSICKIQRRYQALRRSRGAGPGTENHQYKAGRRIDRDGYVIVTAPLDHPYARQRPHRAGKLIFEHRLIHEQTLGRYLLPSEIVDHIDGLTLHNDPSNLRLFDSNARHLQATITGKRHQVSSAGRLALQTKHLQLPDRTPVDNYRQRRASGDERLLQILLTALRLGPTSPYLSGSSHHTTKAGIDLASRPTIERALADLCEKWELDPALLLP